MNKSKVLIVLPAYNEENVVYGVIKRILNEGYPNILVVDDASTDNTYKVSQEAGAEVLRHVVNRGAGAATNTGLIYAKDNKYKHVVFMDSDGQHNPEEISKLLKQNQKYDVVIGTRLLDFQNMPLIRKIANFAGNVFTWIFFGLLVRDSQSGFKAFNRKAMNRIKIRYDRFEFCSEIVGEIKKKKLKFTEVPIQVIYTDHSRSKGQNIKNGFKMIIRFLLNN